MCISEHTELSIVNFFYTHSEPGLEKPLQETMVVFGTEFVKLCVLKPSFQSLPHQRCRPVLLLNNLKFPASFSKTYHIEPNFKHM
jgi:hypothetical protein